MGFPWKKLLTGIKKGAELGQLVGIPGASQLVTGIHAAESIPGLNGPQKREAAKAIAAALVGKEGMFSDDAELAKLADAFCDAYVALANRIAELKAKNDDEDA